MLRLLPDYIPEHTTAPAPPSNPEPVRLSIAAKEAVQAALGEVETAFPHGGGDVAFQAARALRGVELRHGVQGGLPAFSELLREWFDETDIPTVADFDTLEEGVFLAWPKIKHPAGMSPLQAALEHARNFECEGIPHSWPRKVRENARLVLGMSHALADEKGVCFFGARNIAEALGISKSTAANLLSAVVNAGLLILVSQGSQKSGAVSRYRLPHFWTEELRNRGTHRTEEQIEPRNP